MESKNHTHVNKVGHNSETLFCIYWWTWKAIIYSKKCWSGPINKIILIFTMLHLKKKIKKNTWRYHFTPCTKNLDMISSSWDIKCNRLKLVILGQFLPFTPPPPTRCLKLQKSKFLKNEKNCWWYHHLNMCTKNHNHMMCSFWDTSEADRSFCHIGPFFALLPH